MEASLPFSTSPGHNDYVHDIKFNYYGTRIATVSGDQTVKIFDYVSPNPEATGTDTDTGTGQWLQKEGSTWQAHKGAVNRICWAHPEYGDLLATCGSDHTAQIWEEQRLSSMGGRWNQKASLNEAHKSVTCINFAPRHVGLKIATGSADGVVRVYEAIDVMNLNHWPLSHNFTACSDSDGELGVTSLSWCGGRFEPPMMVVGGSGGKVQVWRYSDSSRNWHCAYDLMSHGRSVSDVCWAPNVGRSFHLVASAGKDGMLMVHKLRRKGRGEFASVGDGGSGSGNNGGNSNNDDELELEVGKTEMLDVPNGSQIWRMDFNVTGTVLACSGDIGTVLMYKSDFNGRFKCVSEVSPKTVQKNSDNSYSNSR